MQKLTGNDFVGTWFGAISKNLRFFGYSENFYLDYGNAESARCVHGYVDVTKAYEYELGNCYIKDLKTSETLAASGKQTFDYSSDENNILLFSEGEIGDIYYCKIYENDTLVADFIPATDANGKATFYDNVSKKYFENIGTEDFTAIKELS